MEFFKNRWVYTLTAFICSSTVLPTLGLLLGGMTNASFPLSVKLIVDQANYIGFPAAIAAFICWPTLTKRSMIRMAAAGILTVICAFMIIPLFIALTRGESFDVNMVEASIPFLILGSAFTLGIPYIIAIFVSLAFAD